MAYSEKNRVLENIKIHFHLQDVIIEETKDDGFKVEVLSLFDDKVVAFFDSDDICDQGVKGTITQDQRNIFISHDAYSH